MRRIHVCARVAGFAGLCMLAAGAAAAQVPHAATTPTTFPADSALQAAIKLHASELRAMDSTASAGVWVIADSSGVIKESGILSPFPRGVSSNDIQATVPALRGRSVRAFFMSRPVAWEHARSTQVLWVTLMS